MVMLVISTCPNIFMLQYKHTYLKVGICENNLNIIYTIIYFDIYI